MRTWNWLFTASLLFPLSGYAQQTTSSPAIEQSPASPAQASPALPRGELDPQPLKDAPRPRAESANAVPASPRSATMDTIVDHAIEREHALMEMLKTRTPFV